MKTLKAAHPIVLIDDIAPKVRRRKSRVTRTDTNDPAKAAAVDKILEKYKQKQAY